MVHLPQIITGVDRDKKGKITGFYINNGSTKVTYETICGRILDADYDYCIIKSTDKNETHLTKLLVDVNGTIRTVKDDTDVNNLENFKDELPGN